MGIPCGLKDEWAPARVRIAVRVLLQLHVREERIVELLVQVRMSKKEQEMYVGCFVKRFLFDDLC